MIERYHDRDCVQDCTARAVNPTRAELAAVCGGSWAPIGADEGRRRAVAD